MKSFPPHNLPNSHFECWLLIRAPEPKQIKPTDRQELGAQPCSAVANFSVSPDERLPHSCPDHFPIISSQSVFFPHHSVPVWPQHSKEGKKSTPVDSLPLLPGPTENLENCMSSSSAGGILGLQDTGVQFRATPQAHTWCNKKLQFDTLIFF